MLNNPHNPTGVVYSKQELEKIAQVCWDHNILVIADEIYAMITYEFKKFTSMGAIYPEGTFVTNGLSKDRSDGKKVYEKYRQSVPKTKSNENEFVKNNAPIMVQGIEALRTYVEYMRSH